MARERFADVSDAVLMGRVQNDDVEAFAELHARLAPRALAVARGVLGARADRATDAVQEGFLSMWRNREAYRSERGEVHSWVFGIVRNRAIDSQRRHRQHDRQWDDGTLMEDTLAAAGDVPTDTVAADDGRRLRELMTELPSAQREVIALAYFGQLSHSEIATHLTLPLGTVKGRMRLGLRRLRGHLAA